MSEAFCWIIVDLSEEGYSCGEKKNLKISGGKGSRMDSQTDTHRSDEKEAL